jgi:5-(carboxyamino)imidazole ribonucleotide synthase
VSVDLATDGTLGILGGGQLARLTALAARAYGLRVAILDPDPQAPAVQIADRHVAAALDDPAGAERLARESDVVTCEFENVPAAILEVCAARVPTRPGPAVFHLAQHRLREKDALRALGVPVGPYSPLRSARDLECLADGPMILKTASSGYDGKGQVRIANRSCAAAAWERLGRVEVIAEEVIPFVAEISVLVARSARGEITTWAPLHNHHEHHILDLTLWPAPLSTSVAQEAEAIARTVAEGIGLEGVLCVEMFLTADNHLLVNELAPRPHNSGHLTIEAAMTSQFDQLVRVCADLPLGATTPRCPAAMANLLGDLWIDGRADLEAALAVAGVSVHLYGKRRALRGRKMGHLTAVAADVQTAEERVLEARRRFAGG